MMAWNDDGQRDNELYHELFFCWAGGGAAGFPAVIHPGIFILPRIIVKVQYLSLI
jgi:hypothetical protein